MSSGRGGFKYPHSRPNLGLRELKAVWGTMKSGEVSGGRDLALLEQDFKSLTGKRNAIAFSSWTSAAHAYLSRKRQLTHRRVVLVPSFTFAASVNVIIHSGFIPRFIDISLPNFSLDPQKIEEHLTDDVAGVMVVHYAGFAAKNVDYLKKIADDHGMFLIEDCAEALGACDASGRLAGSHGDSIFSFFATKNITTGEGGILCTDDDLDASWLRLFQSHGVSKDPSLNWLREAHLVGLNLRLSNLQASMGHVQMQRLDELNDMRRRCAGIYLEYLPEEILPFGAEAIDRSSWQMFPILISGRRDELILFLRERGIEASAHFDPPCHKHEAYRGFVEDNDLSVTEQLSSSVVTLPIWAGMSPKLAKRISEHVREFLAT